MNEEKYGLLPDMDWLDINKLVIDTSYQRTTTSKRSKNNIVKITENFAWSRFAPLIVNDNGNNTYNVIDGQHRLEACKRLGDIKSVPCYIVPPQSVSAQAVDFAQTNTNRVIVNNFEVFKAKVAAGDADFIQVKKFLDGYGLEVSPSGAPSDNPNIVYTFATLKKLLKADRQSDLAYAVDIIIQTFPNIGNRFRGELITYLSNAHQKLGNKLNRQALVNALRSFGSPALIISRAKNARVLDPSQPLIKHLSRIINTEYNNHFKILKGLK